MRAILVLIRLVGVLLLLGVLILNGIMLATLIYAAIKLSSFVEILAMAPMIFPLLSVLAALGCLFTLGDRELGKKGLISGVMLALLGLIELVFVYFLSPGSWAMSIFSESMVIINFDILGKIIGSAIVLAYPILAKRFTYE